MVKKSENSVPKKQPEEFDFKIMQANFSALLYVVTEQQALIGKLLQELLASGTINAQQLENVTDIYGDGEVLSPVYKDLYKRFAWYFLRTKNTLEEAEETGIEPPHILDREDKDDE